MNTQTKAKTYLGWPCKFRRAGREYDALIGSDAVEGYYSVDTLCETFSFAYSAREIVRVMESTRVFEGNG
jgi:hypothetical protein